MNITGSDQRNLSYYLPDVATTRRLAEFFALFADSSRLRLLSALAITDLCVTDIAQALNMNQTTVSHQLKRLKSMGIVDYERQGKILYYSLKDTKVNEVLLIGVEYLDQ